MVLYLDLIFQILKAELLCNYVPGAWEQENRTQRALLVAKLQLR
jgi:hypothetical protein